jgi:hypothetical protein
MAIMELARGYSESAKAAAATATGNVGKAIFHAIAAKGHFTSATTFGLLAGGAAIAGGALAATGGGGGGGAGAGIDTGEQQPKQPGQVTLGRGDLTGQIGGAPTELFERMIFALDQNTAASQKIQSQPAGEVFVQGARQRPDAVSQAAVQQARTNAEFVNQFGRIILGPA